MDKHGITQDEVMANAKAGKSTEDDYCFTGCMMLEEKAVSNSFD